jgi:hypothetical protein
MTMFAAKQERARSLVVKGLQTICISAIWRCKNCIARPVDGRNLASGESFMRID